MTMLELVLIGFVPAVGFAFGAGRIVESIRNGKYVKKELCNRIHDDLLKVESEFRADVRDNLKHIRGWMEAHK